MHERISAADQLQILDELVKYPYDEIKNLQEQNAHRQGREYHEGEM